MKLTSISGSGRSGSTFLSVLLTQGDDAFGLGQVRDLWQAYPLGSPCTCGESLPSCPFWSRVVGATFGSSPRRRLARMRRMQDAFRKDAVAIPEWTSENVQARLVDTHARYLESLGAVLSAAEEATGVEAFIDASKSPEIALAFGLVDGVDLRVLNLVRDPRAVACSWERRSGSEAAASYTLEWAERQRTIDRWAPALGKRFLRIGYEDLTHAPRTTVEHILAWAGLDPVPALFTSESHADVSWDRLHLFPPANETVLAERRIGVDVVEAAGWRDAGFRATHEMVEAQIGDLMERYGYRRMSDE